MKFIISLWFHDVQIARTITSEINWHVSTKINYLMSWVDQEKYIRPSVTRETGYESMYFEVIKTRHIIRNNTPRFTKPRLFNVNQANIKQDTGNKKLKRIWKKRLNRQPFVHYTVLSLYCYMYNFQKFWMAVFCSKSGLINRKRLDFVKINVHVLTLYLLCQSSQNPQFQCLEKHKS